MSDTRTAIGGNKPPLDDAEELANRLDTEFADLNKTAAQLELDRFALPQSLETDDDCAKVSGFVAKVKGAISAAEAKRKVKGAPYLAAQRTINDWFKELHADLEQNAEALTKKVKIYNNAKAERERAERLAKEAEERRKADEARREEQRKRDEADAAQREAEAAAARVRMAADAAAREQAAKEMREADQRAADLREEAEAEGEVAAKAERKADSHERAAEGDIGKLSRIAGAGATSSVTVKWGYTVDDWSALRASLGPLGPHLDSGVLETTLARIVRQESAGGATPTFKAPGVTIAPELKTNIRATRA